MKKVSKMFGSSIPKHLADVAKQEEKEFIDGIRKLVSTLTFEIFIEFLSSFYRVFIEYLSTFLS